MFFESESLSFEIVNVFYFKQENTRNRNYGRRHDALSFRLDSDVILETEDKQIELSSGALTFVPAGLDYIRVVNRDVFLVVDFVSCGGVNTGIEYFYPNDRAKYKTLFERIYKIWQEKKTGYRYIASAVFNEILGEAHCDKASVNYEKSRIYPSLKYIEENYLKSDFSLTFAAEKSFVSDVYFRRIFKEEFGISPKKYVINKRMEYAESLIKSGYHSIKEIAYLCGYTDYKYFSVEFKKATGKSPSMYI